MEIGGVGASLNIFIFLWYDKFLREGKEKKAAWALNEEYRRLPLACIAAPLYTIALFWLVSFLARILSIQWLFVLFLSPTS